MPSDVGPPDRLTSSTLCQSESTRGHQLSPPVIHPQQIVPSITVLIPWAASSTLSPSPTPHPHTQSFSLWVGTTQEFLGSRNFLKYTQAHNFSRRFPFCHMLPFIQLDSVLPMWEVGSYSSPPRVRTHFEGVDASIASFPSWPVRVQRCSTVPSF